MTCVQPLQDIMTEVLQYKDIYIVHGHRNKKIQDKLYNDGYSKLKYPKSKHNKIPSQAVDVIPYPSGYKDLREFWILAGIIKTLAQQYGIELRWGRDWDMDNDYDDQTFDDYAHWEIIK